MGTGGGWVGGHGWVGVGGHGWGWVDMGGCGWVGVGGHGWSMPHKKTALGSMTGADQLNVTCTHDDDDDDDPLS